ncbi:hypothetical protein ACERII_13180 [Evansella sp. AB-rgal1]|uniref:hypothetical protein n=1 Tax=Evansella sp. AB-rgal1 TaxID=3242696 RepID=UPI00359D5135
MFNNKVQMIMGSIICILVIFLGVFSSLHYFGVKEDERQRQLFINHLYFSIDNSIYYIETLMENNNGNESLEYYIRALEKNLLEADASIRYGNMLMDSKLYPSDFFRHASNFLYGVSMTGSVTADVPPMADNNELTEIDLALLNTIKGYLENAKQEMYSEQTKQENPSLTIDELNKIIATHLNNHHSEIYKDAFK